MIYQATRSRRFLNKTSSINFKANPTGLVHFSACPSTATSQSSASLCPDSRKLRYNAHAFYERISGEIVIARIALGSETNLTALMEAADGGSKPASDALFSALYGELRRIAKNGLARHGAPVSLSATTLVHQAYIEIAGREGVSFPDRNRFMGYAARVMRGLIIDHARSRCAQKRGGQFEIMAIGTDVDNVPNCRELVQISDALDELAKIEPSLAEVVDLKFFCGFSFSEIAAMKDVSERTIQREWEKARIYLHRSIRPDLEI